MDTDISIISIISKYQLKYNLKKYLVFKDLKFKDRLNKYCFYQLINKLVFFIGVGKRKVLLNSLKEDFRLFKEIDNKLNYHINRYYYAVLSLSKEELENVFFETESLFIEAKNYVYYREYYNIFKIIYHYFYYGIFLDVFLFDELVKDVDNLILSSLMNILLYEYYLEVENDVNRALTYLNKVQMDDLLDKYYRVSNLVVNNKLNELSNMVKKIKKNYVELLDKFISRNLLFLSFDLLGDYETNNTFKSKEIIIDILENKEEIFTDYVYSKLYYRLGGFYFKCGLYVESINWFMKYLEVSNNDNKFFVIAIIIIYLIQKYSITCGYDFIIWLPKEYIKRLGLYNRNSEKESVYLILFNIFFFGRDKIFSENLLKLKKVIKNDVFDQFVSYLNENETDLI